MQNLIICGSFFDGDGIENPLFCDPSTGDLAVNLGLRGACVIGNVSVNDPMDMSEKHMAKFYEYVGGVGIAVTYSYILVFREYGTVEYRKTSSPLTIDHVTPYDTEMEYDGDLEG